MRLCRYLVLAIITGCGPVIGSGSDAIDEGDATGASTTTASSTAEPTGTASGLTSTTGDVSGSSSNDDTSSSGGGFLDATTEWVCAPPSEEFDTRCLWECTVWDQDCLEGDKCMPWANDGGNAWNATRCTPVDPEPGGVGDPCTAVASGVSGVDTCDVSAMCWNVDAETLVGECVGFCEGSEDDPICAPNETCLVANDQVLALCLPSCDPLATSPCEDGLACHPTAHGAWACLPVGAPIVIHGLTPALCPERTTAIDPTTASFCEPDDDLCCAEICDVASPVCAEPLQCTPVAKEGNVGLCLDPA